MKTLEELKNEQYDAKAKLHEIIDTMNSVEFYTLSQSEKNIIGQRRIALEMYLNSLTKSIYDKEGAVFDASSAIWPMLMSSMFSFPVSGSIHSKPEEKLTEEDFEKKEDNTSEEHIYAVPV